MVYKFAKSLGDKRWIGKNDSKKEKVIIFDKAAELTMGQSGERRELFSPTNMP